MEWRKRTLGEVLGVALLASALGLGGCGGTEEVDDEVADSNDLHAEKGDGVARPVGTYDADLAVTGLGYERLVLLSNRRFRRETKDPCNGEATCLPYAPVVTIGNYRFTKSGRTTYIRFSDDSGASIDRVAYRTTGGGALELRALRSRAWQTFTKTDPAWCDVPLDCNLQKLVTLECIGAWSCVENKCSYSCGAPVADCRTTGCSAGNYCTYCWINFACIPEHAVC